ncbi:MAG: WD40 repeat domain-containing protein [Actinomycetota bacterium]
MRGAVLALVPDGTRMLNGADYAQRTRFHVFKVEALGVDRLWAVQEHKKDITSVCVSPDGKLAATGDETGAIKVWDVPSLTRPK